MTFNKPPFSTTSPPTPSTYHRPSHREYLAHGTPIPLAVLQAAKFTYIRVDQTNWPQQIFQGDLSFNNNNNNIQTNLIYSAMIKVS